MAETELVAIGAGNMGEAVLRGVLAGNVLAHTQIVAVDPRLERRKDLGLALNISAVEHVAQAPPARAYLLAVKPQQMDEALDDLAPALPEASAVVISVAAGVSTGFLAQRLGERARIVRAMPNTPMLVGCGCTGVCAGAGATEEDLLLAKRIFAAAGDVRVVDESAIDAVTAVSGSGPAYFFYLIEAMVAAGAAEGLDEATALSLAVKTCEGAARLLDETGEPPAELRRKVTSPGGTTERAIGAMDDAGVQQAVIAAVRAAAARSRELGR
jgi:pyrroline-5-carboxylate reductase